MSSLFHALRIRSEPGAKLYFRATGTSTPQNVYADIDLTTPHANPVVADAEGVFDPIYLDPSLPAYRVIHTDGSNEDDDYTLETLLEPITDDVPSSPSQNGEFVIKSTKARLDFWDTDAATNEKRWRLEAQSGVMTLSTLTDGGTVTGEILRVERNGTTVTSFDLLEEPVYESGSFTATLTGFSSTVTETVEWYKSLNSTVLILPLGAGGTSNATTMTMTGLPAAISPALTQAVVTRVTDNGAVAFGTATIDVSSRVITFGLGASASGAFTGSGSKGLPANWTMVYA